MQLYEEKDSTYFKSIRYDILDLIPDNCVNVLEVGCGEGNTLLELKRIGKAKYIAGVDIVDLGQKKYLDDFFNLNIEYNDLPLDKGYFDVIICADVLEHLIDPWSTVKKLRKYLKPRGFLIASIPNIREIKTMINIFFKGDFGYEKQGILDKTHLRFFCKKNIVELFQEADLKVEKITFNLSPKRRLFYKFSLGFLEEFLVVQYLVVAVNNR